MDSFLDALDSRVLVCDGAMGTVLYGRGVFLNRCFDELNLSSADMVRQMVGEEVKVAWCGGNPDGGLGTNIVIQ